jgi:hypothetical protein
LWVWDCGETRGKYDVVVGERDCECGRREMMKKKTRSTFVIAFWVSGDLGFRDIGIMVVVVVVVLGEIGHGREREFGLEMLGVGVYGIRLCFVSVFTLQPSFFKI